MTAGLQAAPKKSRLFVIVVYQEKMMTEIPSAQHKPNFPCKNVISGRLFKLSRSLQPGDHVDPHEPHRCNLLQLSLKQANVPDNLHSLSRSMRFKDKQEDNLATTWR